MFTAFTYNWMVVLVLLVKVATFYQLMAFSRPPLLWAYACLWLVIINLAKTTSVQDQIQSLTRLSDSQIFDIMHILCWSLLKLLSITLDNCRAIKGGDDGWASTTGFSTFCGYIFYFPTLVQGPILIFGRYYDMLNDRRGQPIAVVSRCWSLAKNLLRLGALVLLTDFALHYIYLVNLQYNIKVGAIFFSFRKFHFK